MMTSFSSYSSTDSRETVEKVLKYSGRNDEILLRADIKREAVVFRFLSGTPVVLIEEEKPIELEQDMEIMIFIQQGDSHSIKEARYNRMFELSDQIIDWSISTSGASIDSDVYTLTLTGVGSTLERDGFLSATLSFQTIIKIQ